MTKDVLVSVRGAHIADGETNNLEVITLPDGAIPCCLPSGKPNRACPCGCPSLWKISDPTHARGIQHLCRQQIWS